MTAKAVKIADIKGPDKVAPAASSRPLVVTNRPVIADPMVVAAKKDEETEAPKAPTRTSKVIKPMTLTAADIESDKDTKEDTESVETAPQTEDKPADSGRTSVPLEEQATGTPEAVTEKPETKPEPTTTATSEPEERDTDAEAEHAKEQAAQADIARQQELDALIASGKYAVPIGAVQRRRSRMYVTLLCVVGLLLAILLVVAALDAGLITAPKSIPHTHFFSTSS